MDLRCVMFVIVFSKLCGVVSSENVVSPVRPLYLCDPIQKAITLSSWYYSCKHSCSPFANQNLTSIAIYQDQLYNVPWNIYLVELRRIVVSSHTDILDNCMYIESSTAHIPTDEDIKEYSHRIANTVAEYPGNKTIYIGTKIKPECSYFRDLYASYDLLIAQKIPGYLITEFGLPIKIKIPSLDSEVYLDKEFAWYGEQWIYWEKIDPTHQSVCSIQLMSQETCISHPNISSIVCQNSGFSFKLPDLPPQVTCRGNLTYIGEGIFISVLMSNVNNNYQIISKSALKIQDSDISLLVSQMNTLYGTFTDTLCESICDISDQLYSISENSSSVLETPLGPWLGWRNPQKAIEHIYYVSACRRTSEWQLSIPLSICPYNSGFTISNHLGKIYLWDPSKTYFIPSDTCNDFSPSSFFYDIQTLHDVMIPFWGRSLVIHPPYNDTYTWLENNSPIHRSSKWTPFLSGYQVNGSKDMEEILDSFSAVIHEQKQIFQARGNSSSPFKSGIITFFSTSVVSFIDWITEGVKSISSFFSLGLKVIFVLVTFIVAWILIVIVKFLYKSTRKLSTNQRDPPREAADQGYQVLRRGEFNPFETGPAPRRSHRIAVEE